MTLTRLSRRIKPRPQVELLEKRALLAAGALDTTFGGTGQVITDLANNFLPKGLAVQSDLKTIVVGIEAPSNSAGDYPWNLALVRYNTDGSLDSTFGNGGEVIVGTNTVRPSECPLHLDSVAIQPDGKIVVATNTATENSGGSITSCDMLVLRFNANGSLDTSFGQNGETDIHLAQGMAVACGVAILPGGQIVVAGTNLNGHVGPEFVVARLTSSGALDTTFGPSGQGCNFTTLSSTTVYADDVDALGVDASGDLLVGGMWLNASTGSRVDQVVRYTPAGLIDTSFANQGIYDLPFGSSQGVEGICFQSNGQIILGFAYNPSTGNGGVTRLNPNGTLDTTFGSKGCFSDPIGGGAVEIAVQPNDEILFETSFSSSGAGILVDQLQTSGSLDPSFGTGGRVEQPDTAWGPADGITVGPDGNITGTTANYPPGNVQLGSATFRLLGDAPVTGQLVVTQQPPASLSAGTPFGLTVEAEDSSDNIESSFNGTVTVGLASNPGGATLGGTLSVTASGGVATFSGLTLTTAASGYTLVANGNSLAAAVTGAMAVTPAAASALAITQQPPSSVTAGSGFALQAAIEDAYGNIETGDNASVTVALASNPGGATLGGATAVTATNGVASFSGLILTNAASGYTLQVNKAGLSAATSSAIAVIPAAATQLVITQQPPATVMVSTGFALAAAIEDMYGNVLTSGSKTVKIAIANNPVGGKLGGTASVTSKQGIASFSGLTINKVGSGYTLQLTSTGLASATTNAINVVKTLAAGAMAAASPAATPDVLIAPLVFESPVSPSDGVVKKQSIAS